MKFPSPALLLLTIIVSLAAAAGAAAQTTVEATLSPQQIGAGDEASLTIQVKGAKNLGSQPVIEVPGLEIEGGRMSYQTYNINGNVSVYSTYQYSVRADKPGEYTIPSVELTIDGEKFQTKPLDLKVTEATTVPEPYKPILQVQLGKNELFEGEVCPLTMSLFIHRHTNISEFPLPQMPRDHFAMKRFARNPDQSLTQLGGEPYQVLNYRTAVTPIKSGDLTLGPAECKVDAYVPDGSGRRDPFGTLAMQKRKFVAQSQELKVKVKPLPEAGRPEDFSGAVGKFDLTAQAQQTKVQAGDPIAVTLYVQGTGNFESLAAPEMENQDGWRLYPAKQVVENRNIGLEPGTVAYSQVIFPERELREIPPFVLTYFDPDEARYVTKRSAAIPVVVTPNPAAAAQNGPGGTPLAASGAKDFSLTEKTVPEENMTSILGLRPDPGAWHDLALTASLPAVSHWQPWLRHGLPAALLAVIAGSAAVRKWAVLKKSRQQRHEAPPKASDLLQRLGAEHSSLRQFYSLASDFLTAWQRERRMPLPESGPAGETVRRIHMRRDFFCYGSKESDLAVSPSEHTEIVSALRQF